MKAKKDFSMRNFLPAIKLLSFIMFIFCCCNSQKMASVARTKPKMLPEKVTGAYAIVKPADENAKLIKGELIAANDQFITLNSDTGLRNVPFANCSRLKLYISRDVNSRAALTAWASILPLFTIAHGILLVLTFPLNFLVVIPTLIAIHGYYVTSYPDRISKETLATFARFPQGLPAGITSNSLK